MNGKVLIIEDDQAIADLIAMYLNRDGLETFICPDGETGLQTFAAENPDLVVLDINLPLMDGYEVLQRLKKERDVPVVMVTARQEDEDAILGFGMGADDYVSKPFSPKVLAARIRMHLSRNRKTLAALNAASGEVLNRSEPASRRPLREDSLLAFGNYVLDTRTLALLKDGVKMSMSPREIDLLIFLAQNPGVPMSPDEIYSRVWGQKYGDVSTVAVHVQRIRKKIEDDPAHPLWLKTAHGRGYYLDGSLERGERR